ncbi:GNAT family protein [Actinoplanes sp. NPDC051861]|uniref:GNAT family N-acetyltransferase n=1 Tax=Actinoplanes sp. NPDC051861 TaxID=3155170 RepID=UPI0034444E0B
MSAININLRPVGADDVAMLQRFRVEPFLVGLDWHGFRDPGEIQRRFDTDGYLAPGDGRLIVDVDGAAAGLLSYVEGRYAEVGTYIEIGALLLPDFRGRGIGWRAQAMLAEYLFEHWPVQRLQAATHVENIAEQKSLVKAGFQLEGVIRACEFRAGQWRDGMLYSRLRDDPAPEL